MTAHWIESYIGTPWVAGETDCWHFARRVWEERFGIEVPALPVDARDPRAARRAFADADEMDRWVQILRPAEGDAVLMAKGRHPCHVGIWVAPGYVLHAVEGAGAICTDAAALSAMGYRVTGHYRRLRA
jgi:cell wall-associated NlpC family hydrolase